MRIWRICSERHVASAFSGEGSRLASGRWNPEGVPIAYASEHLSLAAIEMFVHVRWKYQPDDLVAIEAEFPITATSILEQKRSIESQLTESWRVSPIATQAMGGSWFRNRASVAMMVPSVVIDEEWNILLNPEHPDFRGLRILRKKAFRFDERMFKWDD